MIGSVSLANQIAHFFFAFFSPLIWPKKAMLNFAEIRVNSEKVRIKHFATAYIRYFGHVYVFN